MRNSVAETHVQAWKRLLFAGKKEPLEVLDAFMGCVIIANGLAIGVSCDTKDWTQGWLVVEFLPHSVPWLCDVVLMWLQIQSELGSTAVVLCSTWSSASWRLNAHNSFFGWNCLFAF